jgi:hypothetical protein
MARTSVWRSVFLAALLAAGACTEKLTAPGRCPLCVNSTLQMADTLLTAVDSADLTARGFIQMNEATFLAASNLDSLKSVILLRFAPLPAFVRGSDTIPPAFPSDSVLCVLPLVYRDTTVHPRLVLYRLPAKFDTTMTYAQAQPYLVDANLLDTAAVPDTGTAVTPGNLSFRLPNSFFADSADSGVVAIGIKVIADAPTLVAIGSGHAGSTSPGLSYYVHGQPPQDTITGNLATAPSFAGFAQSPALGATPPGVFSVGGVPSAHTIMHLSLPKVAVDSVNIVRGTLLLTLAKPVVTFPRDSFYVRAYPLLRDYGPKSVLYTDTTFSGRALVLDGQVGTVELDLAPILRLWGTTAGDSLPHAIALLVYSEGNLLGQTDFEGHAAAASPQLRLTYVKKYEYGVP